MKQRKTDHLKICLEQEVETGSTGLESFRLPHCALPEISLDQVDTTTTFLGKKLKAPFLISAITGGTPQAKKINQNLAAAAQKKGVAMGLGSQRIAIKNPKLAETFQVRKLVPDIPLLANLGAVQLNYGLGISQCRQVVKMIRADALVLHLNPLQEAIQPEGDVNFESLLPKIKAIAGRLEVPLIVKEVGAGISQKVAGKLFRVGVKIIDTAGWGGTNWAKIEGLRGNRKLGETFSQWGIPTTESIVQCRKVKGLTVIGSGGIRNGIEAAKAIALGADLVGLALPFLKPATQSARAVEKRLDQLITELKVSMFCLGVKNLSQLKRVSLLKI